MTLLKRPREATRLFLEGAGFSSIYCRVIVMCECILQLPPTKNSLAYLKSQPLPQSPEAATVTESGATVGLNSRNRDGVTRPNMQVSAILNRCGHLDRVDVRWGWAPIWSMGTRPPLTHLPLHLVMRSKAFQRIRGEGRALVAVDGWFEMTDEAALGQSSLIYTTSRSARPMFLAALAQVSDAHSGCDGLVLLTHENGTGNPQQLLAFDAQDAMKWLAPDLEWEQALQLATHHAVSEADLEHLLTAQRAAYRKR